MVTDKTLHVVDMGAGQLALIVLDKGVAYGSTGNVAEACHMSTETYARMSSAYSSVYENIQVHVRRDTARPYDWAVDN